MRITKTFYRNETKNNYCDGGQNSYYDVVYILRYTLVINQSITVPT